MELKPTERMLITRQGIWNNWSAFAQISPFTGFRTSRLCALKTFLPCNSFNFVFGENNVTDEEIDSLFTYYGDVPFSFEVEETEKNLIQKLESKGFAYRDFVLGMEMDLQNFKPKSYPKDIKIREINSKNDFIEWLKIVEKGFYQPLSLLELFFGPIYQTKSVFHFYIAFLEDIPVGTSYCHVENGIATLFYITTLPDYQRRGIGTLLVSYPIQKAIEKGAKKAVLQSTDMGLSVYEKMGFRKTCKYEDYVWKGQM